MLCFYFDVRVVAHNIGRSIVIAISGDPLTLSCHVIRKDYLDGERRRSGVELHSLPQIPYSGYAVRQVITSDMATRGPRMTRTTIPGARLGRP
jgi:hypothetical protein